MGNQQHVLADAVASVNPSLAHAPVILVHMLEAWLILAPTAIRQAA
ncbi:hypothetical protein [Streptomyces sp. NBC_01014]|nr:hypothetical protein OG282_11145 [Streptomyces sp. NBC_01014]